MIDEPAKPSLEQENRPAVPATGNMRWYVLKVQSGSEDLTKGELERRVKISNLEECVGRIFIPTEQVTELHNGKRVLKTRKKFPGYLMCEAELSEKLLCLFRETSGVDDFVGAGQQNGSGLPLPMSDREVERMLRDTDQAGGKMPVSAEGPSEGRIVIPYAFKDRLS